MKPEKVNKLICVIVVLVCPLLFYLLGGFANTWWGFLLIVFLAILLAGTLTNIAYNNY